MNYIISSYQGYINPILVPYLYRDIRPYKTYNIYISFYTGIYPFISYQWYDKSYY